MKCQKHPEVDAVDTCKMCGKPICKDCRLDFDGKAVCYDCAMPFTNLFAGIASGSMGAISSRYKIVENKDKK